MHNFDIKFVFFCQITSGGIIMLRDAAESHDGPEELIEPLKGMYPLLTHYSP
jgi:hypothetical protein